MKKILKRKKLIIVLAIIVAVIIALIVYGKHKLSQMSQVSNVIELEQVQKRDLSDFISLTGTVSGESRMNYTSSAAAEITALNVVVGDEVKEGDVIATLDAGAIQSQINMIETSMSNASALEENQKKLNQRALDQAKADQKTQLAAANQSITDAQTAYNNATNTYNSINGQISSLNQQLNGTQDEEQRAALSDQIAALKEELTAAQSEMTAASQAVTEAKNNYNSVKSSTDEAIYSAQNTIDMQQYSETDNTETRTQLEELYSQLEDCTVVSKTNGIVTAVNVSVGDTNTPGSVLVTVENDQVMVMTASVDEKDILKLQEGMKAVVTSDALDDQEINGEVIKVVRVYGGSASGGTSGDEMGMSSSSSGGFSVQIRLDECELLSGMSAKARVTLSDRSEVMSVPYDLVMKEVMEDGESQFYILCGEANDDGTYTAVRKNIKIGEEVNYYVEVLSGDLQEGDYIIMDYSVQEGDTFEASITEDTYEEGEELTETTAEIY